MTVREVGSHFWDWVDRRTVFRRSIVIFSLFLTYDAFLKCIAFAETSKLDGIGIAAIIAAVLVPVGAVQKFAFDLYNNARGGQ